MNSIGKKEFFITEDALGEIFSYVCDDLKSISLTCKQWEVTAKKVNIFDIALKLLQGKPLETTCYDRSLFSQKRICSIIGYLMHKDSTLSLDNLLTSSELQSATEKGNSLVHLAIELMHSHSFSTDSIKNSSQSDLKKVVDLESKAIESLQLIQKRVSIEKQWKNINDIAQCLINYPNIRWETEALKIQKQWLAKILRVFFKGKSAKISMLFRYAVIMYMACDSKSEKVSNIIPMNHILWSDKRVVLLAVKKYTDALKHVSDKLKEDKEVALAAINKNANSLLYASSSLKKNKAIVLAAIEKNPFSIAYAAKSLKNDKNIALAAIKKDGRVIYLLSKRLKNDIDIARATVKSDGKWLALLSQQFRGNKSIVLEAVNQNGYAYPFASQKLKNDKDVVIAAIKNRCFSLEHCSEKLQNIKEVVLVSVQTDCQSIQFASKSLKNNEEIILEVVKRNGLLLKEASENLRGNDNVVLSAIQENGLAIKYAHKKIKNNYDIALIAVQKNPGALFHVSERLKQNKMLALIAVKGDSSLIQSLPLKLQIDEDIIVACNAT